MSEKEKPLLADTKLTLAEEELTVAVVNRVKGIVRLEKTVSSRDALVTQELMHDSLSVERIPVNRFLDEPAVTRYEGNTTIIPVMEEIAVVSKRLVLREEIRLTRRSETVLHEETVALRSEQIDVERIEPPTER